ncbi:sodium:solute symporter family transporter [Mannheimia indoligenes]|uniref:sodium:solute symporter family transporter n=1 Tax=Mannheimia indoligenes TaxID=3103145 RepID=UPI002FE5658D
MFQELPPIVVGIFLATPIVAIMSPIDSMLIQASSPLIKNLYLAELTLTWGREATFLRVIMLALYWKKANATGRFA